MNSARFLLFGPRQPATISLRSIVVRKGVNVARGAFGMPPTNGPGFTDWLWHQIKQAWARLFGLSTGPQLPDDLPLRVFTTVNDTLKNRGGLADKDLSIPNYWVSDSHVYDTPFFWVLPVDYSAAGDPTKAGAFESVLEDQLIKAGYPYNVRIQLKPLRIEIDKPESPTINLADLWQYVCDHRQNERQALLGIAFIGGETVPLFMTVVGEDFSVFIAGSPGSGKTQLSMSILLSLAMTNSPDSLSMIIIDPKAVDFQPFNALPHLAMPIVYEPLQAAAVVQSLCDEMDMRTARAARSDKSFFKHSILLYVDELADLAMSLPKGQADELTANIQRLGQKGRGVGFVVIGATQRVFDIPASMHSKLNARIVGKMRTAGDSSAASGIPGTTTNLLPGRGSFELYSSDQMGLRIQAPFVAASDQDGYDQQLEPFFADIIQRWQGHQPGWMPTGTPQTPVQPIGDDSATTAQQTPQNAVQPAEPGIPLGPDAPTGPNVDPDLLAALTEEYSADPGAFRQQTIRRVYSYLNAGKRMNAGREKLIFDWFVSTYATNLLESN